VVRTDAEDEVAPMIRLIAAIDTQRGIATATGIPWTLPGDSAYFRDQTATGAIVMGWATYEEFAAPLHDRVNFVLSTHPGTLRTGFSPVGSLDQLVGEHPGEDVWVIGGAAVYAATLPEADELWLTQVEGDFHCTKFFPPYGDTFGLATRSPEHQDGAISYRFETWRRSDP
jgi:dihydrofolate reductase